MESTPMILVASTCSQLFPPDDIIKRILETQELPEALILSDGIRSYPWHIDTKYYEVDVRVCALDTKTIVNQAFADSVNAVIICFDGVSDKSLCSIEQWVSFTKLFEADINILLCERCIHSPPKGSGVQKIDVQKWCVEHKFELVELSALEDDMDSEVEDDFPESVGMKRVIQALHAHFWPNLKLKDIPGSSKPNLGLQCALNELSELISESQSETNGNILEGGARIPYSLMNKVDLNSKVAKIKPTLRQNMENSDTSDSEVSKEVELDDSLPSYETATQIENEASFLRLNLNSEPSTSERNRRSEKIDSMLEAMDALPEENFELLFQNLSEMKAKAVNLSPTQRRMYAEKMTLAFWRSIAGNESEINGLSSDEEVEVDPN